jgi:hypothetical protein
VAHLPDLYQAHNALVGNYGALVGDGSRPLGKFDATSIVNQIASPRSLAGEMNIGSEDTDAKGPKGGFAQKKVLKKKQDLSGRSTIIPSGFEKFEPTDGLDIDEVGLPEEMAWTMYEPFVRNRLSKRMGPARAKKEYENRSATAKTELQNEMEKRPVMLNRAPSWWAYNIMAHKPVLIEEKKGDDSEKAIRMPNMVVNPYYGGDHGRTTGPAANPPTIPPTTNLAASGQSRPAAHGLSVEAPITAPFQPIAPVVARAATRALQTTRDRPSTARQIASPRDIASHEGFWPSPGAPRLGFSRAETDRRPLVSRTETLNDLRHPIHPHR